MPDVIPRIQTPIKVPHLVLAPSYRKGEFDSHTVDCPFLFSHDELYYMTCIGYQTGPASSTDSLNWRKG